MSGAASFEVIVCPTLIGESTDVLDRPRLRKRLSAESAREFVAISSILPNHVPDRQRLRSRRGCRRWLLGRVSATRSGVGLGLCSA